MNQPPTQNSTEAIRSDIDHTRRKMDDTMDALAERLQPRHLLDEFLGFLRRPGDNGESHLTDIREKLTESADTAMHAVVNTVKKNPLPALLIGAGIAWMIFDRRREPGVSNDGDYYGYDREGNPTADPDMYQDRPLVYPTAMSGEEQSKLGELKDTVASKASDVSQRAKEKLSHAGQVAKEKMSHVGQAAKQKAAQIGERASQTYDRTRQRVATTADQHPLEVGLACLATGLIAGLALPTPSPIQRRIGPAAERLRERTKEAGREMMAKGRHVAQAAVGAAKEEAKAQGLTPGMKPQNDGNQSRPGENFRREGDIGSGISESTQSGP